MSSGHHEGMKIAPPLVQLWSSTSVQLQEAHVKICGQARLLRMVNVVAHHRYRFIRPKVTTAKNFGPRQRQRVCQTTSKLACEISSRKNVETACQMKASRSSSTPPSSRSVLSIKKAKRQFMTIHLARGRAQRSDPHPARKRGRTKTQLG